MISHPGASYGGVVHEGRLAGLRMCDAFHVMAAYLARAAFRSLAYRSHRAFSAPGPAQADIYTLVRSGAVLEPCDLPSSVYVALRRPISERRPRGLRKAAKAVLVKNDDALLRSLWGVLGDNVSRKHEARYVRSPGEFLLHKSRSPSMIRICCALADENRK